MKQENRIDLSSWETVGNDFCAAIAVSREQLETQQILTIRIPDGRELKVKLSPLVEGARLRFRGLINRGRRDLYLEVKVN